MATAQPDGQADSSTTTAAPGGAVGAGIPADDLYVEGGTKWESFELADLIAMVSDKASVPQLERLADDWRAAGNEVVDSSITLSSALDALMGYWSGMAAEQARRDVALNAQWVADLGETAYRIGDPVQEAAGALKAAQDAMPQLPVTPATPPAQAADSAALAEQTGGPLAAAISGAASGSESAFAAEQDQAKLKAVAVEAMRRFEGAAMGIDQATPQFEERATELRPRVSDTGPSTPVDTTAPTGPTDPEQRWDHLTGGTTTSGYEETAAAALPGAAERVPTGGAATGGGYGGGYGGGGGGGGIAVADTVGTPSPRPTPLAPAPGIGATEALPGGALRGGTGGVITPAAAGGAHAGGAPVGGMPMGGAGMAGGQNGDSGEHRRRYPFGDEDSFLLTDKSSPPVIGL
ncbi:hypothetical protein [Actinokineospora pegani]|uniref:hypothetical protein n=1 Tax=Actinokineospora pegani TaxID=2654637 RepID=UPI0012EA5EAB|nr:hypothetical protein [Actinokineospora pegani]